MCDDRVFKDGDKVRVDEFHDDWVKGRIDGVIIRSGERSYRDDDNDPPMHLIRFEGYGGGEGHGQNANEWYVTQDHIALMEPAKKPLDTQYMLTDGDDLLEEFASEAEAMKAAHEFGSGRYMLWRAAAEIEVEAVSTVYWF